MQLAVLVGEIVHVVESLSAWRTATCSGITSAPQPSSRICRSAISERKPPSLPGEADAMAKTRPLKAA